MWSDALALKMFHVRVDFEILGKKTNLHQQVGGKRHPDILLFGMISRWISQRNARWGSRQEQNARPDLDLLLLGWFHVRVFE